MLGWLGYVCLDWAKKLCQANFHRTIQNQTGLLRSTTNTKQTKLNIPIPEGGPKILAGCAIGLTGVTVTRQPRARIQVAVGIHQGPWSAKDRPAESRGVPSVLLPSFPDAATWPDDFETRPEKENNYL